MAVLSAGCQDTRHVVLIDVYSQAPVSELAVTLLSRDSERPQQPHHERARTVTPARTPAELLESPLRVAVELDAPISVLVHVRATTPEGETLIATRCYVVDGVIRDEVLLVLPGDLDADGDSFVRDPAAVCREIDPQDGTERPCEGEPEVPPDYICPASAAADCDDQNSAVFPGGPFICMNGIDEDCDGIGDADSEIEETCGDRDGDGVDACSEPPVLGCDCNDNNGGIFPGAPEVCLDGIDQDCDGADACCDEDGDGYRQCRDRETQAVTGDCVDRPSDCPRGPDGEIIEGCDPAGIHPSGTEICDGIDNNCDGRIDELDECRGPDLDGDGVPDCSRVEPGTPCDCNDCDAGIRPGARELCVFGTGEPNGIDEDCDGMIDEVCGEDGDGDGVTGTRDCDETDPFAFTRDPGEPDVDRCDDGVAQNCVPGEDRSCADDHDGDGFVEPATCEGDDTVTPGNPEACNQRDDNCNGVTDEVLDPSGTRGCAGGESIDFTSDDTHCGVCRYVCDSAYADQCNGGVCDCAGQSDTVESCDSYGARNGFVRTACCTDGCKDLANDRDNCGECGFACGPDEVCSDGLCRCGDTRSPTPGSTACNSTIGEACCGDACRNVRNNANHCGGCGLRCGRAGTPETCVAGACTCSSDAATPASGPACRGGAPFCGPSGCIECLRNDDCEAETPFCDGSGACVECLMDSHCDDGNECTDDTCSGGACTHPARTGACTGGTCLGGACCTGCNDAGTCRTGDTNATCGLGGVDCTTCTPPADMCVGGSCVECTRNGHCDDGNECTDDSCSDGTCTISDRTGTCESGAGTCVSGMCCTGCVQSGTCEPGTSASACGTGGGACLSCTGETGICDGGSCVGCTDASHCDDSNECTDDSCDGGTCTNTPRTGTCMDGSGVCLGTTCCTGCNDGGTCRPGDTDSLCGAGGGPCASCAGGASCSSGVCRCGSGGGATECTSDQGDSCTGNICRCAGGDACSGSPGDVCLADGCS